MGWHSFVVGSMARDMDIHRPYPILCNRSASSIFRHLCRSTKGESAVSYKVVVHGDGEKYWIGFDDLDPAFDRFKAEQKDDNQVSLIWEGFDWEPE